MVVDDEPGVRELAVQMLRANGFEAEDVASGEEALARVARQPRAYDLVLLDLAMPQMDGLEVRRALLDSRPNLPILMMSGYADLGREDSVVGSGGSFIRKPFRAERLVRKVSETLARVAAPVS